jgi:hypothetical protein
MEKTKELEDADLVKLDAETAAWLAFSEVAKDIEKSWRASSLEQKKALEEWKWEPGMVGFAEMARLRYLKREIKDLKKINKSNATMAVEITKEYAPEVSEVVVPILAQSAVKTQTMIDRYEREVVLRKNGAVEELSEEAIQRAREYPMEQIIPVGRSGRAKCVFHDGKDENMDIRKNYAYCYVCNKSSDAIGVYMKVHDCTFKQAIQALQ